MTDLISRLYRYGKELQVCNEAADEIERLRSELANVNNEFGSQTADWPDAWKRVAELKQLSNDRWRENERLQALNSSLTRKANSYLIDNARLADRIDRAKVPVLCTYPNCDCKEPLDTCPKNK